MADLDVSWKLRDGFSRLLRQSELQLNLRAGPARLDWAGSPWQLAKKGEPIEIHFEIRRSIAGRGPGGLRWKLTPRLAVRSRILWAGDAYLGNFRVPAGRLGVEWRVEAETSAELNASASGWLAGVEQGSRLTFTWVETTRSTDGIRSLLQAAWSSFVDPLDAAAVAGLSQRQALRFAWRGDATLGASVQWSVVRGWSVARSAAAVRWTGAGSLDAGAAADVQLRETGRWSLLVSRRRGRLRVSVQREREGSKRLRLRVRATGTARQAPRLAAPLDPIADPLRRELRSALRRRIGAAVSLEAARIHRRHQLLKASWSHVGVTPFADQYRDVLRGRFPINGDADTGLAFESLMETVRRKVFTVELNVFDWFSLVHRRRSESALSVRRAPDGSVTIEHRHEAERLHRWRGQQQLMALLASHLEGERPPLVWTAGWSGRYRRGRLKQILRAALHSGVIEEIRLPALEDALPIDIIWRTRFSPAGIETVLGRSRQYHMRRLAQALELHSPDLYRAGSALRDWIDYREVRELIDRDPAAAHLASRYPIGRRSHHERVQAVASYRRAKGFLELLQEWAADDFDSVLAGLHRLLRMPTFIFFHLACPKRLRRSALLSTGPVPISYGEPSLLEELAGVPVSVDNESP